MTLVACDPELARLLELLHPSELALREWVGPRLDASMLAEVATADYGFDTAEHRLALEDLYRARWLPDELSWHPGEVLALTRWSTVDASSLGPAEAHRQHVMRLFCCLMLVRATTAMGSPVNSLSPLMESAVELGSDAVDAATRFLAWCRLHEPGDWRSDPASRPVLTLALVVLSAMLPAGRTPELLPGLVAAFLDELSAVLADENRLWTQRPLRDLFKLTALAESRRIWAGLAGRCLIDGPAQHTDHGVLLARLGEAIRGDLTADATELRALLVPLSD